MVDERERACDEDVLAVGGKAEAYAESVLKVCEFYLVASDCLCSRSNRLQSQEENGADHE